MALEENSHILLPILIQDTLKKDFSTIHSILHREALVRNDVPKIEWTYLNGVTLSAISDKETLKAPSWFGSSFGFNGEQSKVFSASSLGFDASLTYRISSIPIQNKLWEMFIHLSKMLAWVISAVILFIIFVLRKNLKIINSLSRVTHSFSEGEYGVRLTPEGAPEIKAAINSFNEMAESIETLLSKLDNEKRRLDVQLSFKKSLLENLPTPVFYLNSECGLVGANPSWESFFGLRVNDSRNKNSKELFSFDKNLAEKLFQTDMQVVSTKKGVTVDIKFTGLDKKDKHIVVYKTPLLDPQSQKEGVICSVVDLSDLTNAVYKKEAAEQASEIKSQFLANMSHEIRTPLTAIMGNAESLYDGERSEEGKIESINTIVRAGKHLAQLINDLLDLSKVEAGKLDIEKIEINIPELINEIANYSRPFAEAKKISFNIEPQFPIPEKICCDPLRLKQILINLLNNAVKFTEQGSVCLGVSHKENKIIFSVKDTGIGITEEQAKKLFSPFTQADMSTSRKYGGTGLGLYLSKLLAEKLGGTLELDNNTEEGSNFIVSIPVGISNPTFINKIAIRESETALPKINHKKFSGRVLLVEDNPDNQNYISYLLKKNGLSAQLTSNGQEALDSLQSDDFDLIFMDMQMPVMDGPTAAREIRKRGIKTTMVALTANASTKDKQVCLAAGYSDFLAKPIDTEKFVEMLSKYLVTQE